MQHFFNYINGQWQDSSEKFTIMNPATAQPFATIAKASIRDTDRAMQSAKDCVQSGQLTEVRPAQRTQWLLNAAKAIREITERGIDISWQENGKSIAESQDEFVEAARYFEYYAGMADKIEGSQIPLGKDYIDFTQYVPMGISVQIVPWNFPVSICARSLAPALAAGNAVVIKSPEISPIAMTLLVEAVVSAGFPKGAVQLLCGDGAEIGNHLVNHTDTNQIVFTGSVATGQHILRQAAQNAIPSVMELGGKSAAIALADVDLSVLLSSVKLGIFYNAGQVCSAMSRLVIHQSRYEEIKEAIVRMVSSLKLGAGNSQADVTPVISDVQQQRVLAMVEKARQEGATILTGGKAPNLDGYFVEPTIIEATPDMRISQEEVFGPVLVIMPFDDEKQAIEIANGTKFGLVAGVFGENINQTLRMANQLRAGQVFINEWFAGGIETPFGGVGLSGFGREKGQEAIYSYVQTRNIGIRLYE